MSPIIENTKVSQFEFLLSWRSIIAGAVLSMLFYILLIAAGVGVGGISMQDGVANAHDAGIGAGIWIILATALALFGGSYIATRTTSYISRSIGMWQSAVISAVFFIAALMQVGSLLGTAGRTLSDVAGLAGSGAAQIASDAANSPAVQDILETAVDQLNLRSSPDAVVKGVGVRLLQGDGTAARDYLARQAGITPAEAQIRIDTARQQATAVLMKARETAGQAVAATGWMLFITMLVGLLSAMGGGYVATIENVKHPVSDDSLFLRTRTAHI